MAHPPGAQSLDPSALLWSVSQLKSPVSRMFWSNQILTFPWQENRARKCLKKPIPSKLRVELTPFTLQRVLISSLFFEIFPRASLLSASFKASRLPGAAMAGATEDVWSSRLVLCSNHHALLHHSCISAALGSSFPSNGPVWGCHLHHHLAQMHILRGHCLEFPFACSRLPAASWTLFVHSDTAPSPAC